MTTATPLRGPCRSLAWRGAHLLETLCACAPSPWRRIGASWKGVALGPAARACRARPAREPLELWRRSPRCELAPHPSDLRVRGAHAPWRAWPRARRGRLRSTDSTFTPPADRRDRVPVAVDGGRCASGATGGAAGRDPVDAPREPSWGHTGLVAPRTHRGSTAITRAVSSSARGSRAGRSPICGGRQTVAPAGSHSSSVTNGITGWASQQRLAEHPTAGGRRARRRTHGP